MKKVNFDNLVIEVTRRCNMKCNHCSRGDAEDMDISSEVINTLLRQTDYINLVTFTGGEPTLNIDAIEYFYEKAKKLKIDIGGFYLVTNGKIVSERLAVVLLKLYSYCSDNEISSLVVSKTKYHWPEGYPHRQTIYDGLSFFHPELRKELRKESIIGEGRAIDYGLGYRSIEPEKIEVEDKGNCIRVENMIYINCKGDILTNCDFSYESQDEYKIGNVLDPRKNISHILEEQLKKEEEEEKDDFI